MDPYKVLGIPPDASPHDVKRAYLAKAAKYHPDAGGDAWVFEQVRSAYELLSESPTTDSASKPSPRQKASGSKEPSETEVSHPQEASPSRQTSAKHPVHRVLFGQLPLQTETSWFILTNVLDLVLTNILLRFHAIEANPIANFFLAQFGFTGMISFKLLSVAVVCILAQLIATRSPFKAKILLWAGCKIVGLVLIYSCRLLVFVGH